MSTLQPQSNDSPLDAEAPTVRRLRTVSSEVLAPAVAALPGTEDQTVISGRPVREPANASTPSEAASVLIGRRLDHFVLEELIGGGGMGAVFRARDMRLDRIVAVKVLPGVGQDPDLLRRFRVEAQSAARLDHPHIARIYDVGEQDGWHYIVFEYIEGFNVRDLVSRQGPLSIEQAISFTYQAAEALQHAWQRGVVHRDVKPSNLLADHQGHVRLVDMGLARAQALELSDDQTASNVTLGTFDYISPEQARDPRVADVRSDLYSLGCTLYFMLTGEPPFPGGTIVQKLLHHGSTPAPDPRLIRNDVSDDLAAVGLKLLSKDPDQRYQEPEDLLADLAELARRERLTVTSLSPGLVAPRELRGAWWMQHLPWIAAVGMLITSIIGLRLAGTVVNESVVLDAQRIEETPRTPSAPFNEKSKLSPPGREATVVDTVANKPSELATVAPFEGANEGPRLAPIHEPMGAAANTSIVVGKVPAPGREVVATLAEAMRRAGENPSIKTIDIDVDELSTGKLTIPRNGLTIQAANRRAPIITFEDATTQFYNMQRLIMVDTAGHDLRFNGIHLTWQLPSTARDGGCLIQLSSGSQFAFKSGSITMENPDQTDEVFALEIVDVGQLPQANNSRTIAETSIQMENFIIRGDLAFCHVDEPRLMRIGLQEGLIAISGSVLQMEGFENRPAATEPKMEIMLRRMTIAARNLADVWLGPSGRLPPRIERNSMASIFVNQSNMGMIEFHNLAPAAALTQVPWLLEGNSNQYERPSDPLVRISTGNGQKTEWPYGEALKYDWFKETQTSFATAWNGVWPVNKPLHQVTIDDYAQEDPGTGFTAERLPVLRSLAEVEFD